MADANKKLFRMLESVDDEKSFVGFVEALAIDRADEVVKERENPSSPWGPGANGWENGTIEHFLLAGVAWASASASGLSTYEVPQNPWKRCAQILYMGKIYE